MLDPEQYLYEVRSGIDTFTAADRAWCEDEGRRLMKISVSLSADASPNVQVNISGGNFAVETITLNAGESLCLTPNGAGVTSLFIQSNLTDGNLDWIVEAWKKV
jgi:hypothetical protein